MKISLIWKSIKIIESSSNYILLNELTRKWVKVSQKVFKQIVLYDYSDDLTTSTHHFGRRKQIIAAFLTTPCPA